MPIQTLIVPIPATVLVPAVPTSRGCGGANAGCAGAGGTPRGQHRVIDLPTLLGLANNPARLDGYGTIPAALARRIAADASWRRMITDPITRRLLDRSPNTYRPGDQLAAYVRARDLIMTTRLRKPAEGCQAHSRQTRFNPTTPTWRTDHRRGAQTTLRTPPQRQNPPRLGHRHPSRRHPLHPQPPRLRLRPRTQPLPPRDHGRHRPGISETCRDRLIKV